MAAVKMGGEATNGIWGMTEGGQEGAEPPGDKSLRGRRLMELHLKAPFRVAGLRPAEQFSRTSRSSGYRTTQQHLKCLSLRPEEPQPARDSGSPPTPTLTASDLAPPAFVFK